MKSLQKIGLFTLLIAFTYSASAQSPIEVEARNYEQSIRGYNNGELVQADRLLDEALGIVKILRPRERRYGALEMISLLEKTAAEMTVLYPDTERLQVGDISNEKGGKAGGHDSHTNGLDTDLAYYRMDRSEIEPNHTLGYFLNGKRINYVAGGVISPDFDIERNFKFIQMLYSSQILSRIFVDALIKKTFCEYTKQMGIFDESVEILRKLRPWPNHADHMHVRIDCPKNSIRCTPQAPIPMGSGCDTIAEDLFTAELMAEEQGC